MSNENTLKAEYNQWAKALKNQFKGQHPDMVQVQVNYILAHITFERWVELKNAEVNN